MRPQLLPNHPINNLLYRYSSTSTKYETLIDNYRRASPVPKNIKCLIFHRNYAPVITNNDRHQRSDGGGEAGRVIVTLFILFLLPRSASLVPLLPIERMAVLCN